MLTIRPLKARNFKLLAVGVLLYLLSIMES